MRIGVVTCRNLPEPDPDAAPLQAALEARGHVAVMTAWDDPDAPTDVDLYAVRSTWNYYEAPEAFVEWCRNAAARKPFLNPPDVIAANIDKRYLLELEGRGLPIVPTRHFDVRTSCDVVAAMHDAGWNEVVIKPAISAGSWKTRLFAGEELAAAQRFFDELVAERAVLLQRCMPGFDDPGERSLIWIDGSWTHAIRKRPRFAGQDEQVLPHGEPTARELEIANGALSGLTDRILYARVDLVPDDLSDDVVISEVELIEPSLFFDHSAAALERYIDGLERHLEAGV